MFWALLLCGASRVVLTEVMANPAGGTGAHGPEDRNEFVELYNPTTRAVDLYEWTLDDGDSRDRLVPWQDSAILAGNPTLCINQTWLPPGGYAVVVDSEYTDRSPVGGFVQPYRFGDGALVLTTRNTTLGNGLAGTDFVSVESPYGDTSTFGTPQDSSDSLPRDAGDGRSWERVWADSADRPRCWSVCPDSAGCTPGRQNAAASLVDLALAEIAVLDSAPRTGERFRFTLRVANTGFVATAEWYVWCWLDRNRNSRRDPGETFFELDGWLLPPGKDSAVELHGVWPGTTTDLWATLDCPADADSSDNRIRAALVPGGSGRLLSLPLSSFTPNGDGFEDELPVVYHLPAAGGRLSVLVFNLAGRAVRTVALRQTVSESDGTLLWDGRDDWGRQAPVGVYAVWLEYRLKGETVTSKLPAVLSRRK